jgi:hypothetical protein
LVDAVTPLAIAGYVNDESQRVLGLWKQGNSEFANIFPNKNKLSKLFFRSCKVISCKAGSLYVMKSSILPANLNHLAQLTLNLLIAYPHNPSAVAVDKVEKLLM